VNERWRRIVTSIISYGLLLLMVLIALYSTWHYGPLPKGK
jgi:hypothetical protein